MRGSKEGPEGECLGERFREGKSGSRKEAVARNSGNHGEGSGKKILTIIMF